MFTPTKEAALDGLDRFVPNAGRDYAAGRNYDNGPYKASTVSRLSPWIRNRTLPEWEVLSTVLERHSVSAASKFIDEVCWRTYWKGWLQLRPGVWHNYIRERAKLLAEHDKHVGYQRAVEGRTGIDCFDAWNRELIETNYLHNHARMWYASIWVHTLKLPWQLGADWFLRHLLDGDPASNTLSWRWVAGLHTPGKTYLARPDNIRKYTGGRFEVEAELAKEPLEIAETPNPPAGSLKPLTETPGGQRLGLLVTEEDLSAADWLVEHSEFACKAGFFPRDVYQRLDISKPVTEFRRESLYQLKLPQLLEKIDEIVLWSEINELEGVVISEPTAGPGAEVLSNLAELLSAKNKTLFTARHWWDATLHPHATHGFFRFKKAIPKVLGRLQEGASVGSAN